MLIPAIFFAVVAGEVIGRMVADAISEEDSSSA